MLRDRLTKLEYHLQALIEGTAARLFPSSRKQKDLASQLVEAMRQGIRNEPNGSPIGPNLFSIYLPPSQAEVLKDDPALLEGLSAILQEESQEAGIRFDSPLVIHVLADASMEIDTLQVRAEHSAAHLARTSALENVVSDGGDVQLPKNAFLIVDGTQIFTINQTVTNLGRRPDNHLIINDPRVSRVHAQIRYVRNQFLIFDLDSSGGTWVNGTRIRQSALQPGDVISLSGLPIVFGQEANPPEDTQEYVAGG